MLATKCSMLQGTPSRLRKWAIRYLKLNLASIPKQGISSCIHRNDRELGYSLSQSLMIRTICDEEISRRVGLPRKLDHKKRSPASFVAGRIVEPHSIIRSDPWIHQWNLGILLN